MFCPVCVSDVSIWGPLHQLLLLNKDCAAGIPAIEQGNQATTEGHCSISQQIVEILNREWSRE